MPQPLMPKNPNHQQFSESYRQAVFALWYSKGKPNGRRLQPMITEHDPILGVIPSVNVLYSWIGGEFAEQAKELDEEVGKNLSNTLIAEKIEMLKRHADVGKEMQNMGLEYLRENGVGGARNAIQLLVEGLEIERGAVGAPQISQKLMSMSDEQLLDELKQFVAGSPIVDIQPNDDISE